MVVLWRARWRVCVFSGQTAVAPTLSPPSLSLARAVSSPQSTPNTPAAPQQQTKKPNSDSKTPHLRHQRLAPRHVPLLAQLPHAYAQPRHAPRPQARAAPLELVDDGVDLLKVRGRRGQQLADAGDLGDGVVEVELGDLPDEVGVGLVLQGEELLELLVEQALGLHLGEGVLLLGRYLVGHSKFFLRLLL